MSSGRMAHIGRSGDALDHRSACVKEWGRVKRELLVVRAVGIVEVGRVFPSTDPRRLAGAVGRADSAAEACIRAASCA
jgi:hypothetical protein